MGLHEIEETTTQAETNDGDEDYIDMEVSSCSCASSSSSSSSSSSFISFAVSSPPHSREFEFQMCSSAAASGEPTTSPADELFYKGQLLPLHLPPRLQMVQKLLETSAIEPSPATATASTSTPLFPGAVSPCESGRLSSDNITNPEEHFFEISTELKNLIGNDNPRSTWNKKVKQIKQSSLTQKLKASHAYIRALFTKPGCADSEIDPKSKTEGTRHSKSAKKKNPFGKMESFDELSINRGDNNKNNIRRRSFSGVIQRHCPTKCLSSSGSNSSGSSSSSSAASSLSSSFSFGSNGSLDLQFLGRSSSASSEIDNSIEGAIAHCKQSFSPRKSNVGEAELCSSRALISDQERTEISRI